MSDPVSDPVNVHRKEVAQRIQVLNSQGGWEGTHGDFKRELGSNPQDLAKLLKHILAFANTPRRTDAYIIYGVNEDKVRKEFTHVGVPTSGFPSAERVLNLIRDHTNLHDVAVDAHYSIDGKRTPYVVIPLQYEGPCFLVSPFNGSSGTMSVNDIYRRYGTSSMRAMERDVRRMREDWDQWFLDCHYEKNATCLMGVLKSHFPNCDLMTDEGAYIRFVYTSVSNDEFGTHEAPVLVHAYWGFDPVDPKAVVQIAADSSAKAFGKTIIGPRFTPECRQTAMDAAVRCVPLDEIYFVNDSYAQLCRVFLHQWNGERSDRHRGHIVDLDFRLSKAEGNREPKKSILSFLEEQLQSPGRTAIVVHGDFGCGKTTTAKQLVVYLCEEYLRGNSNVPKVVYLDVNNIDIRSRRDECLENQLNRTRLSREHIDRIVAGVRNDDIQLVFDGVDEMARPYTEQGRDEAMELLRDMGNRRAAAYFVRSSYFPKLSDLISQFERLADVDFATQQRKSVAAEIMPLRQEQVTLYLDSRIGSEKTNAVRRALTKTDFASFLMDPLIVSMVADFVDEEGVQAFEAIPSHGEKARFLGILVDRLLKREQHKRTGHTGLAEDFTLFQRFLWTVAFNMVSRGSLVVTQPQLEAFVQRNSLPAGKGTEYVNSFRTMSWVHRSDDGALAFRHEALALICAAEHVWSAFERRDFFAIADWQPTAPLADVVLQYAGAMATSKGLLGSMELLGGDLQFNVRQLVRGVLKGIVDSNELQNGEVPLLDDGALKGICLGIANEVHVAQLPVRILFRVLAPNPKKALQVALPLLMLLARSNPPEAIDVSLDLLQYISKTQKNFYEDLHAISEDRHSMLDMMLLKTLGIGISELFDSEHYEDLFKRIHQASSVSRTTKQFAERTLRSIEGERQRRENAMKRQWTRH